MPKRRSKPSLRARRRRRGMLARTHIAALLLLCTGVLGTGGLIASVAGREAVRTSLESALDDASARYRRGAGLETLRRTSVRAAQEHARKIAAIGRERRGVRLEIASLRQWLADIRARNGLDLRDGLHAAALAEGQRRDIGAFIRSLSLRPRLGVTAPGSAPDILEVLVTPIGGTVDAQLRRSSVLQARARLYAFLVRAKDVPARLAELEERHAELSRAYRESLGAFERADATARVSDAQLAEIKRIMAEVHADVLRLQSELSRIDARIARRVERELIEKGLRAPRPGSHSDPEIALAAPLFAWPVVGPVSAGFREESYERYFGIPHEGTDIVTAQGTPVRAAADGVVFLARDGGQTGYSYILVGHRNGYATLYGHLSAFTVRAGDDVSMGDVIGMSGGQPGTYGAGPMTTGAHLHFEIILRGENVDPETLLP